MCALGGLGGKEPSSSALDEGIGKEVERSDENHCDREKTADEAFPASVQRYRHLTKKEAKGGSDNGPCL